MPPIQAGELDSGSFIILQNNTPVCWIHSDKTSPTGYEHWWWKTGFSPPAQAPNSEVVWKVRRDVYGVDDWDTWQADHGPDAPLPEQRTSVWVVHETRSEQP